MTVEFILDRGPCTSYSTPGTLYVRRGRDKQFLCYTLEDVVRPDGEKVPGKTAIPPGKYDLSVTMSARFKKNLPLLASVPNFTGVRIHGGNTHENTEGCILVGLNRAGADRISNCAPALAQVMALISQGRSLGQPVTIEIRPWSETA